MNQYTTVKSLLHILYLEDDPKDAELVQATLLAADLVCHVTRVDTQPEFSDLLARGGFDLILADYTLPSFDGISALQIAKEVRPEVPFIFVSGTLDEEVAIDALKVGATDYVFKTRLSRIVPSVQRALREAEERAERKRAEDGLRAAISERTRLSAVRAEIGMALARKDSLRETLRACVEAMVRHLDAALARIWTVNTDAQELELQASAGMYTRLNGRYSRIPLGELKIGLIAHKREAHLTNDVLNDPRISDHDWARAEKITSFAGYPLVVDDRVAGVMGMFSRSPLPQSTLDTLAFVADGVAQGIERKHAEEKLRRSEAYLTEAQRLSQTGSFGCALSTGKMSWSEETFRIYGYDQSTKPTVGHVLQRVHPEDKPLIQEHMDRASREGKACDVECRLVLPDDSVKHVRIVAHAAKNESGILEFIGAVMDVTATKQAEETLRRSEAYLAEAQRLSHTGSFGWRPSTGEILWSEEAFRIFGYDRTAKPTIDLVLQRVHPEDAARVRQTIERASQDAKDYDHEYRLLTPDGSVKHLHVAARVLRDQSGNFEFVGAVTDITDRKHAEDILRASEQSFRLMVDSIPGLVNTTTAAGEIELANQQLLDYVGKTLEELKDWRPLVHPDDLALAEARWSRSVETGHPYDDEHRLLRADGVYRWFHLRGHPMRDKEGQIVRWYILLTDIDERKNADEKLRRSEARLRQVQADLAHVTRVTTMGELTASLAHEVNQPIAATVTNASAGLRWLAAQPPDLEEARQALGRIIKDGNRAGEVIRRIRALVKESPPQQDRLDINETILEVVLLTGSEVHNNRVSLQTQLSNELPLILGDRVQLQQVILNLIKNAVEAVSAVSERPRELLVSSSKDESKGVLVAVRDSGPGLGPEARAHLFDPFYTTKPEGMGMGLAISRSIIEAHGGRLWATPNQPHGAVFQFTLPAGGDRMP